MYQQTTWRFHKATLGLAILCGFGCASQGQPGFSIEATTGSRTGNPFEIRLTASRSELKAVIVNRSSTEQKMLLEPYLQAATLELVPRRYRDCHRHG